MPKIERSRKDLVRLIAENPNYFGNFADSGFKAVEAMVGNTKYEEITCVGFDPRRDRLEATVALKLPFGYGGDLCERGTTEYVRFYLDYRDGNGWVDMGVAAFRAHDIPDGKDCAGAPTMPLSFVVSHPIDPERKPCNRPQLPLVRAILSWRLMPPPNQPDWPPIWGNVVDHRIQIRPSGGGPIFDLNQSIIELIGSQPTVKLPPELEAIEGLPIELPIPPAPPLAKLAKTYAEAELAVEPHRFGFESLKALTTGPGLDPALVAEVGQAWQEIDVDLAGALGALEKTKGNVSYEELECLGLDPNKEQLVATFRIKRPTGFLGNLCQPGSKEYVSFWADWDDQCEGWTPLGTVEVSVHDIASIPRRGLCYAAFLPVDLREIRRPCGRPKIGRVRAVLSWNVPAAGPDAPVHWGNRLDAHVLIPPGEPDDPQNVRPLFHRIGGIRAETLDPVSGLTTVTSFFDNGFAADGAGRPCPFAARVVLTGPPFIGERYRIQVRRLELADGTPVSDPWQTVSNTFWIEPLTGPRYPKTPVPGSEYFIYETFAQNPDLVLGWWQTSGDDLWEVKLDLQGHAGAAIHRVRLKNGGVEQAEIHIALGGDCGKFTVGQPLSGHFVARDPYLNGYSLGTSPFGAPAGQLVPSSGTVQTPAAGSPWDLDTTGMQSCGYVVNLQVSDRAIVNSVPNRHHRGAAVGFCLLEA